MTPAMLSPRERKIALATGILVVALVLYQYIILPLTTARAALARQQQQLTTSIDNNRRLLALADRADRQWNRFHHAGLGADASKAESALLGSIRQWSQQAGLTLIALRPDRAATRKTLNALTFQVAAQGSMRAVTDLLYLAQSAQHPVHVGELQLASQQAGADRLSLQMRISSLWESSAETAAHRATPRALAKGSP